VYVPLLLDLMLAQVCAHELAVFPTAVVQSSGHAVQTMLDPLPLDLLYPAAHPYWVPPLQVLPQPSDPVKLRDTL
jgi:hypothetical protein